MPYSTYINKEIDVTSVYFGGNSKKIKSFPKRIECDGQTYTFTDGLQLVVNRGNDFLKIFCMTDESRNYRILQDVNTGIWTLQTIATR